MSKDRKFPTISKEFFDQFTLMTTDNLFYSYNTLYIIFKSSKCKLDETDGFMDIPKIKKAGVKFEAFFVLNNEVKVIGFVPKESETQEDYDSFIRHQKNLIREYIKQKRLYGKKI